MHLIGIGYLNVGGSMRAFARSVGLALVALIATCEASLSQTIAETATKWGLLGAWRTDCNTPVSLSNGELRYVVKGGKLLHDREFGDRRDSSPVTSATLRSDGSLDIVI